MRDAAAGRAVVESQRPLAVGIGHRRPAACREGHLVRMVVRPERAEAPADRAVAGRDTLRLLGDLHPDGAAMARGLDHRAHPFDFFFRTASQSASLSSRRKLNWPAPCSHSPPSMVTTSPLM